MNFCIIYKIPKDFQIILMTKFWKLTFISIEFEFRLLTEFITIQKKVIHTHPDSTKE